MRGGRGEPLPIIILTASDVSDKVTGLEWGQRLRDEALSIRRTPR